jgi:hypothetical protein
MKRSLDIVFGFLERIGISVWLGAIAMLGFAVAGTLFRELPLITMAGNVNGKILAKMNLLEELSAVLLVMATAYRFIWPQHRTKKALVKAVLLGGMICSLAYYAFYITPRMDYLKHVIGDFDHFDTSYQAFRDEFDAWHKLYTKLVSGNLLMGLAYLFASTIEDTPKQ